MGKLLIGVVLVKAPKAMAIVVFGIIALLALAFVGFSDAAAMLGGMAMTVLFVGLAIALVRWVVGVLAGIFQFVVLTALRVAVSVKRISRRVGHAPY